MFSVMIFLIYDVGRWFFDNINMKFNEEKWQNSMHAELAASYAESGAVCHAELFPAAAHPRSWYCARGSISERIRPENVVGAGKAASEDLVLCSGQCAGFFAWGYSLGHLSGGMHVCPGIYSFGDCELEYVPQRLLIAKIHSQISFCFSQIPTIYL